VPAATRIAPTGSGSVPAGGGRSSPSQDAAFQVGDDVGQSRLESLLDERHHEDREDEQGQGEAGELEDICGGGSIDSADLAVTKTVSNATPRVGDVIAYTVTLRDVGPSAATGAAVTDLLPAGLTFISATPSQGSYNAATGQWVVGALTTAAPQTLQVQAMVVSTSTLINTAAITGADQVDPVSANNSASVAISPN
jgi:uncharacterized repeat protein (TIGR01451 family)